jgi:hypothetical protein
MPISTTKKGDLVLGIIGAIIIILGLSTYFFQKAQTPDTSSDPVVATVGDVSITQSDIDAVLNSQQLPADAPQEVLQQYQDEALENLITTEILYQYASRSYTTTDLEIQTELQNVKNTLADEASYQAELERNNITEETLIQNIQRQLTIKKFLDEFQASNQVTVTDQEVQDFYDAVASENENIPPLEDVQTEVQNELTQQKLQTLIVQFIEELKNEIPVEVI